MTSRYVVGADGVGRWVEGARLVVAVAPVAPDVEPPVPPEGSLEDVLLIIRIREGTADGAAGRWLGYQTRYWCVGCGSSKQIGVHRSGEERYLGGASWAWNGDRIAPVLTPSQLHRTYVYPRDGTPAERAEADRLMDRDGWRDLMMDHPRFGRRCHTFIGINGAPPGHVIFLGDCTHKVRGVHRLLRRCDWPDKYWARA